MLLAKGKSAAAGVRLAANALAAYAYAQCATAAGSATLESLTLTRSRCPGECGVLSLCVCQSDPLHQLNTAPSGTQLTRHSAGHCL